jgi:hypothetical protein
MLVSAAPYLPSQAPHGGSREGVRGAHREEQKPRSRHPRPRHPATEIVKKTLALFMPKTGHAAACISIPVISRVMPETAPHGILPNAADLKPSAK